MIGREAAIEFAINNYPYAVERLVEQYEITVRDTHSRLADGWCLQHDGRAIIRLNQRLKGRGRRFTLAHELAHLILGIPVTHGETFQEMIQSDSEEERRVNALAAELLMPLPELRRAFPNPPVVAGALKRFAKASNVSELSAAIRVCNAVDELGLNNASVVSFRDDELAWQWSQTLRMSEETAHELLCRATESAPKAFRAEHEDDQLIVASVLRNPYFESSTLFVQLLPREVGEALSPAEKQREFEDKFLNIDPKFRASVQGVFGAFKPRCEGLSLDEAVALFWERNERRFENTAICTAEGRLYVRLRIEQFVA